MGKYDDIIDLPHHVSETHPPMSRADRAAQFSPFAALTGYDAAVRETARVTERRIELDEGVKAELNARLNCILEHLSEHPQVSLTYFVQDERKAAVLTAPSPALSENWTALPKPSPSPTGQLFPWRRWSMWRETSLSKKPLCHKKKRHRG